jgi:hypothetical protein
LVLFVLLCLFLFLLFLVMFRMFLVVVGFLFWFSVTLFFVVALLTDVVVFIWAIGSAPVGWLCGGSAGNAVGVFPADVVFRRGYGHGGLFARILSRTWWWVIGIEVVVVAGEDGEVMWYSLGLIRLWWFCLVVLERVRRVDTPC